MQIQNLERAKALAEKQGFTMFNVGDEVVTNHGNAGRITDIRVYGTDDGLWLGWSTYQVSGEAFGRGGMLVDLCDAHYTLGGTLRKAQ